MKRVFADTSYWIALLDTRDAHHRTARHLASDLVRSKIVTSEFILLELLNAMSSIGPRARGGAVQVFHRATTKVRTVWSSRDIWRRGIELYAARSDKRWSFTDCTSFLIMNDLGIREALSSDRDFEQAGFVVLLRDA